MRGPDRLVALVAVGILAGTLTLSIATGLTTWYTPLKEGTPALVMGTATLIGYAVCVYPRIVGATTIAAVTLAAAAWQLWPEQAAALAEAVITAIPLLHLSLSLIISILFFIFILRQTDVLWLMAVGCVTFTVQWLCYVDAAYHYLVMHLIAGLSLSAYLAMRRQAADAGFSALRAAVYGLVTTLAVAGLAQILPNHFRPINIESISMRLVEAFPSLQDLRGPEGYGTGLRIQFSLALSGFGADPDELGGPVTLDRTPVLRLRVRGENIPPVIYLRGVARNTYTGKAWYTHGSRFREFASGLSLGTGQESCVPTDDLVLEFTILKGPLTTLFAVLEPRTATLTDGLFLADEHANLLSPRALNRGEVYYVLSRVPRYNSDQIKALSGGDPSEHDMASYLRLPVTLPARVAHLAWQVAGDGHPYDQARAIENYLRSIPYSLDPPTTPSGRDFVDFFLFDLRRGYCLYHSTAMAVMLRVLGIPSRWVEGYAVKLIPGQETIDITNTDAHAWVEAYFPGYGWVCFEPTPSFPAMDHNQRLPEELVAAGGSTYGPVGAAPVLPALHNLVDDSDIGSQRGRSGPAGRTGRSPVFLVTAALALLAARVGWSAVGIRSRERLSASCAEIDPAATVRRAYNGLTSLLADFGLSPHPASTPARYAAHLAERFPDERLRLQALANWYGEARYGWHGDVDPVTARAAVDTAHKLLRALMRQFIRELGPVRFLWLRLIVARGGRSRSDKG